MVPSSKARLLPSTGLTRRTALLGLGAASLAGQARAQSADWPTRPIRILVGYPAGGANDLVARAVATSLSQSLGQPIAVENRTGAAGTIAADAAKRADPDGTTLYMMSSAQVLAPFVRRDVGFDPVEDFAPIAMCASAPYFLVVHESVPARNVAELVALAKAQPSRLSYASSGVGAGPHLTSSLFMSVAGIELNHIPYRGDADALVDLTAGRVQVSFISVPPTWPHIESGRLRGLAVSSAERLAMAPNIPSVAESGYPGFDMGAWWGLVGPKGLPQSIVDKVATAVRPILDGTEFGQRFASQGISPARDTPASFAQRIAADKVKFAEIVQRAGITPT
jgi:tripartite-type tricarboxylate transporter receptor subunit TctC